MAVQVEPAALDREPERPPARGARCGGCAARPSRAASAPRGRARRSGCPSSRPCEEAKCVQLEPELAARSVHQRDEARARCRRGGPASAIAASLPDTISRPFSSVSSRTRRPRGSSPTPEPGSAAPPGVIRTGSFGLARARSTSSAVMIFVRLAIGSTRSGRCAPQHLARVRRRTRARRAAACRSCTWKASTPASGTSGAGSASIERRRLARRLRARAHRRRADG